MRSQIRTIWETINRKAPKNAVNARAAGVVTLGCCGLALLFFLAGISSFRQGRVPDGLLSLALALLGVSGAFLKKRLLRQGKGSAVFCVLLALLAGCASLRGEAGLFAMMFALFMPVIAVGLSGLRNGILISGCLAIFFICLFYLPVPAGLSAGYPAEIRLVYPLLYALVYAVNFLCSYHHQKQRLTRQSHEQTLESAVRAEHSRLMAMMTQTIQSISNAVDAKDSYTKRHSSRVAEYSVLLAKALGWEPRRLEQLYSIALLHDIGKIGVSDQILKKHSDLTGEEYEAVRQHTVIGGEILKDLTLLPNASVGAVSHHERFDGTGYPYGLKGAQIRIEARIIGIADAFDAMNSSRVYRSRMAPEQILQELQAGSGRQFDPELLDKFLPIAGQLMRGEE